MKESITKFDLEAAFKALDEIDVPKADKGIKANRPALSEVFSRKSKFDALFEEYYDISNTADLTDAKDERDAEVAMAKLARIEKIVDLDADSPDQLLPSYVGKYIMQCPQCMTLFYKDQEDIEESEEDSTVVNVNEVCQHCGNESGYTLIGKVGAADEEPADLNDGEPEEVDVDSYDETEGEDFDVDVDNYEDNELENTDDSEDLDLDLAIEDDETEEDTKEESFYIPSNSTSLVEDLEEEVDLEVSDSDFKKLISSPEFKKPISDEEVEGMLSELGENREKTSEHDVLKEEKNKTIDTKEITEAEQRYLDTDYVVITKHPSGRYTYIQATPPRNTEEQAEADMQYLSREDADFLVVNYKEARQLVGSPYKNSVEEQLDEEQEELIEGGLGLLGKTLGKKLKQTGQKIKDKASAAIDKFADDTMTREEKADWVLNFALESTVKEITVEANGELSPDQKGRKYNNFLVFGFKSHYSNGKPITMMPSYKDTSDLVYGMPEPQARGTYKEADDLAQGWSQRQGGGPAFIYLAKDKTSTNATFLCGYFKGELKDDNLEKYFQIVKKDIEGKEKIEKGGGVQGEASKDGIKTEEVIAAKLKQGDKILLDEEVCEVMGLSKSKFSPDVITLSLKMADGSTDTPGFNQNAKVTRIISGGANESFNQTKLSSILESLDEIHEESLEKVILESLLKNYKNITNFKLVDCFYLNECLNVSGVLTLDSGKERKTTYVFTEAFSADDKLKLVGFNKATCKNKQFTVDGRTKNKIFITESFNYNTNTK